MTTYDEAVSRAMKSAAEACKAASPDTDTLSRRIGWLRYALYNIEIGRCHDTREHAHEALWRDDLIAEKTDLEKNRLAIDENRRAAAMIAEETDRCIMCGRPIGEHSMDTADVCNAFIGGSK